ncbi:MAG: MauE/DoxX family redox-associated membrane protein [Phycisphaerales bacterium]
MTTGQRIDVVFTVFVRLFLAGVFGFAAFMKLRSPDAAQAFAESIQAFKLLDRFDHHHVVVVSTFAVPWLEAICAVLILLGLWTRAAAFAMLSALGVFMYAIYTAIARDMNVQCGCFGDFSFPCDDTIGMCQMYRNGVLAAGCLFLVIRGGGRASFDRFCGRSRPASEAGEPSEADRRSAAPARAKGEGSTAVDPARPAPLSSPPSGQPSADAPPKPRWD